MADRFQSIVDLDVGGAPAPRSGPDASASDQTSFLDRERALLGEDADQFATGQERGGASATVEDGDEDLLGGDFSGGNETAYHGEEMSGFESSFPAIDTQNENVAPGGTITGTTAPYESGDYTNYSAPTHDEEPEPIREWRSRRDADLARRDEASAKKKEESIATARTDIDSFYESYNRKTDKQKAQTQKEAEEFLKNREDTTAGGTSWERIAKLTDLSGKGQVGGGEGSTKKRMREMLMSLKGDKEAPGAGGL